MIVIDIVLFLLQLLTIIHRFVVILVWFWGGSGSGSGSTVHQPAPPPSGDTDNLCDQVSLEICGGATPGRGNFILQNGGYWNFMPQPTKTWPPTHGHGVRWKLEWDGSFFFFFLRYMYSGLDVCTLG